MTALKTTPFHQAYQDTGTKLVDFTDWELPIYYGSQIAEHEAVRTDTGMFDISHMSVTDVTGANAKAFFRKLVANDVAELAFVGKAPYSALLNDNGGMIDDLIVYRTSEAETQYRIVSNGATREKDAVQFHKVRQEFGIASNPCCDLGMSAIQGPKAIEKLLTVELEWADVVHDLKPFQGADLGNDWFVVCTGYTDEDSVEVILPGIEAVASFKALQQAGVQPCGLNARDTLCMEAGMNLYGNDMDDDISPFEVGMGWTVDLKDKSRDFVGKAALLALKEEGVAVKQVGLLLDKGGILRARMEVLIDKGKGETTSGVLSPSLKQSIAIARVPKDFDDDTTKVLMCGKEVNVRVLKLSFVRNGQKQFD